MTDAIWEGKTSLITNKIPNLPSGDQFLPTDSRCRLLLKFQVMCFSALQIQISSAPWTGTNRQWFNKALQPPHATAAGSPNRGKPETDLRFQTSDMKVREIQTKALFLFKAIINKPRWLFSYNARHDWAQVWAWLNRFIRQAKLKLCRSSRHKRTWCLSKYQNDKQRPPQFPIHIFF